MLCYAQVLFVIVTTAFAFYLISLDDVEFRDASGAAVTSYTLMLMGEISEAGTYDPHVDPLMALLFLYATFFANIVLLNALIAIMSDTFDRVSETRVERGLLQRGDPLPAQEPWKSMENNGKW